MQLQRIPIRTHRILSTLLFKLKIRLQPLPEPSQFELSLIEELRKNIAQLPDLQETPEITCEKAWMEARKSLRCLIEKADPREFLTWDVIRRNGIFGNSSSYIEELETLRADPSWVSRWEPVLKEDKIGRPEPFFGFRRSSGTLIHHAYHVQQFEALTKLQVGDFRWIMELGGGMGRCVV